MSNLDHALSNIILDGPDLINYLTYLKEWLPYDRYRFYKSNLSSEILPILVNEIHTSASLFTEDPSKVDRFHFNIIRKAAIHLYTDNNSEKSLSWRNEDFIAAHNLVEILEELTNIHCKEISDLYPNVDCFKNSYDELKDILSNYVNAISKLDKLKV